MRRQLLAFVFATAVLACAEQPATGPDLGTVQAARGSGGGPNVKATDPDTGFRNTTIDVRVFGSGFDRGSRAVWALDEDTAFARTKIKTNSTSFTSSTELVANITIGADAPFDLYDVVVVTASGKKGIGIELFTVTYQIVDLGTLGGVTSEALGINNFGYVVGWSETATGARHAFLWSETTGMQDLGTLGGANSEAYGINDAGEVVGLAERATGYHGAFRWTATSGMQDLGPAAASYSQAFAINANGEIGGRAVGLPSGNSVAVVWTPTAFEEVDAVNYSWGIHALNTAGQAVGWADVRPITARAMLYTRTASGWTVEELPAGAADASARGINIAGQVVGEYRRSDGGLSGFVWTATGGVETLPALPRGARSEAWAINDNGQIAGFATERSGFWWPVVWTKGGDGSWTPQKLPKLSTGDSYARAINARGDMAGFSWSRGSGGRHAVIWKLQ